MFFCHSLSLFLCQLVGKETPKSVCMPAGHNFVIQGATQTCVCVCVVYIIDERLQWHSKRTREKKNELTEKEVNVTAKAAQWTLTESLQKHSITQLGAHWDLSPFHFNIICESFFHFDSHHHYYPGKNVVHFRPFAFALIICKFIQRFWFIVFTDTKMNCELRIAI